MYLVSYKIVDSGSAVSNSVSVSINPREHPFGVVKSVAVLFIPDAARNAVIVGSAFRIYQGTARLCHRVFLSRKECLEGR